MNTDDKQAFAERLKLALRRSTKPVETPTDLALQFNLRHDKDPVTPQAALKWLSGKAKPTSDKIATLAEWLEVSAHWLNYGSPDARPEKHASKHSVSIEDIAGLPEVERQLLTRYRGLSARRQQLLQDLLIELSLDDEVWPETK